MVCLCVRAAARAVWQVAGWPGWRLAGRPGGAAGRAVRSADGQADAIRPPDRAACGSSAWAVRGLGVGRYLGVGPGGVRSIGPTACGRPVELDLVPFGGRVGCYARCHAVRRVLEGGAGDHTGPANAGSRPSQCQEEPSQCQEGPSQCQKGPSQCQEGTIARRGRCAAASRDAERRQAAQSRGPLRSGATRPTLPERAAGRSRVWLDAACWKHRWIVDACARPDETRAQVTRIARATADLIGTKVEDADVISDERVYGPLPHAVRCHAHGPVACAGRPDHRSRRQRPGPSRAGGRLRDGVPAGRRCRAQWGGDMC
jgi:hypothetical protein